MDDIGYPLDLQTPVRHVATEMGRVAPAALSVAEMAATYRHPNPSDISRVRSQEGCANDAEAVEWLLGRAVEAITHRGKAGVLQVEQNGDGFRLARREDGTTIPFEDLRYGRKAISKIRDDHAQLRDPFNPMSGEFAENVRRLHKDDPTELRESMQNFGWVEEFPAIKDERGVVLVGHRRLAIAEELGITPIVKVVRLGDGDEADAKRFRLAVASNLGGKPFTPPERKRIAQYLYGEHDWSMQRVAKALAVSTKTVSLDLRDNFTQGKKTEHRGRPRKLTPEQEARVDDLVAEGVGRNEIAQTFAIGEHAAQLAVERAKTRAEERARQQAGLCTCPNCGNTHEVTHGDD